MPIQVILRVEKIKTYKFMNIGKLYTFSNSNINYTNQSTVRKQPTSDSVFWFFDQMINKVQLIWLLLIDEDKFVQSK